ncbi:cold-shock protein [Parvularcula sp. IMCC14364]|uniref:cold-shock protein n=1 Tax=Parvularcula sp. IMCC14364 TaxID=3067902 RepID=UPI0027416249|nr:cold-shock protein [Parvularcula sp. IMCC14364]
MYQLPGTEENETDMPEASFEVTGIVKWFDTVKGYGFIISEQAEDDILLHSSCLKETGLSSALEGSTVICEAVRRPKGLQATRVLKIDESTAATIAPPVSVLPPVEATGAFEQAEVKWFNRAKGYGFLTQGQDSEDIFVHMETMRRSSISTLVPGQVVQVSYGKGPKGLLAVEIKEDTGN